jgi:hypothetical protein
MSVGDRILARTCDAPRLMSRIIAGILILLVGVRSMLGVSPRWPPSGWSIAVRRMFGIAAITWGLFLIAWGLLTL